MATRWMMGLVMGLVAVSAHGFSVTGLWQSWPRERFVTAAAPCLRHADLQMLLEELAQRHPGRVALEEVGQSFLGRSIRMMTIGTGDRKVLLWSQMHGNEPSATPALLDLAHYLLANAQEPGPRVILEELTLLMIPMLNPDGTELYVRRNAQAIDINRDALSRVTPEGRILKEVRDRYEPILGFNLHDQNRRKAVGDTGILSTNSVLAVAGDPEGTVTPGRMRAKRACSAIVEALEPFIPGGMARYDEDWSPRAFGDNLTAWGTPVVLIESGGLPAGHEMTDLTRLNFVALLTTLQDLAANDLEGHDPQIYEDLPRTEDDSWAEVVIRNGYLLQPGTRTAYRADLSFYLLRSDRQLAGCAVETRSGSMIFEIGDSRFIGAGLEIDGTDALVAAPFVVGVEGWSARKWLDAETLTRLSKVGVGTVRWSVKERKREVAEALAEELRRRSPTEILVVPATATLPPARLRGRPKATTPTSLRQLLQILGVDASDSTEVGPVELLQRLWDVGSSEVLPVLRRGRPASFVLFAPAPEGRIDLDETRLRSVWLDGEEIQRGG